MMLQTTTLSRSLPGLLLIMSCLLSGCRRAQPEALTAPGEAAAGVHAAAEDAPLTPAPTSSVNTRVHPPPAKPLKSVPAPVMSAADSPILFRGIGAGHFNGLQQPLAKTPAETVIAGISDSGHLLLTALQDEQQVRVQVEDLITGQQQLKRDEPTGLDAFQFAPGGESFTYRAPELNDVVTWTAIGPAIPHPRQTATDFEHPLAFSPDGRRVALRVSEHSVQLRDVSRPLPQHLLTGHQATVQVAAFSRDGQTLVTGDAAGQLIRWNVATGAKAGTWSFTRSLLSTPATEIAADASQAADSNSARALAKFRNGLTAIAISPDQRVLAVGTASGYTQTFDMEHGTALSPVFHQSPVTDIIFASDVASLLVVTRPVETQSSNGQSGSITRWWRAPPAPIQLTQQDGSVRFAALDVTGQRAVTGGIDRQLRIWDAETKSLLHTLDNGGEAIAAGALSPDGRRAVTAAYGSGLTCWDLAGMKSLGKRYGHQKRIWTFDFAADNDTFASGSDDQTVRIWSFSTQKTKQTITLDAAVRFVRFSPDGQLLVTATLDPRGWQFPARLQLWNAVTAKPVAEFQGHRTAVNAAVFSADGRDLFSYDAAGLMCRWQVATGKLIGSQSQSTGLSCAGLMGPRGLIVTRQFPNGILMHRSGDFHPVAMFPVPTRSIADLNVAGRGNRIIAGTEEGTVYLWDLGHE